MYYTNTYIYTHIYVCMHAHRKQTTESCMFVYSLLYSLLYTTISKRKRSAIKSSPALSEQMCRQTPTHTRSVAVKEHGNHSLMQHCENLCKPMYT